MTRTFVRSFLVFCCLVVFVAGRWTDEGMWLLDSVNKLPLGAMKKSGLELTPDQIYNSHGTSLKDAIILLGGGTASFISAEGLILTNHHVAYGAIQALSSLQDDYLKNGFYAASRDAELQTSTAGQLVKEIRDVTPEILVAINDTMSAEQRAKALQRKIQDVEKAAKGTTSLSCRVSEAFSGLKYYLYVYEPINDIRLVYAPPGAIGNYGGEIDNWIWPRHTGDFSIMRAYVAPDGKPAKYSKDNIPFKPKVFLPISTHGFTEGSFAMIIGFPGRTYRYQEAAAVELAHDETLPATIELYKTRIDVMDAAGKADRAIEIKYASKVRGIANTYKKYVGILEGMRQVDLLTLKRNQERDLAAHINASPELVKKYGTLLEDLEKANADLKTTSRKNLFLMNLAGGLDIYRVAARFKTFASSFTTDSTGQTIPPSEKDRVALKEFIGSTFKNFDIGVEQKLLVALLLKGTEYPSDQQPAFVQELFGSQTAAEREAAVKEYVEKLYRGTKLATPEGCASLVDEAPDVIKEDPYVSLVSKIDDEQTPITTKVAQTNATLNLLRQKYVQLWITWKKGALVYPDANRSIRFTYGQVEPFSPRDGVMYKFETTLGGVIEKDRGEEPFDVPAKLKDLWKKHDFGRYSDPLVDDVPVAFISDLDITGGNSGSPVMNGKGELIGCAFDGNWESVVGDYYFQHELNRTIAVDARYILFILDKYSGANNILRELVIK